MKTLKRILQLDKIELQEFCRMFLEQNDYKVINTKDYLYAKGDIPIMLVAHLDTVHSVPEKVYVDTKEKVMWSPTGIGGDDRCGVYAVLKILSKYRPYVLFTQDEEIGCLGAKEFIKDIKEPDLKYIIELDRRGSNDCVFYDCGNEEFQEYIKGFGFEKAFGSFTDIRAISSEWDIASVNLSIGYQNEHTTSEIINFMDVISTIKKVCLMLEDEKNAKKYDLQKQTQTYRYYYGNDYYQSKEYEEYIDWWDKKYAQQNSQKNKNKYEEKVK